MLCHRPVTWIWPWHMARRIHSQECRTRHNFIGLPFTTRTCMTANINQCAHRHHTKLSWDNLCKAMTCLGSDSILCDIRDYWVVGLFIDGHIRSLLPQRLLTDTSISATSIIKGEQSRTLRVWSMTLWIATPASSYLLWSSGLS